MGYVWAEPSFVSQDGKPRFGMVTQISWKTQLSYSIFQSYIPGLPLGRLALFGFGLSSVLSPSWK